MQDGTIATRTNVFSRVYDGVMLDDVEAINTVGRRAYAQLTNACVDNKVNLVRDFCIATEMIQEQFPQLADSMYNDVLMDLPAGKSMAAIDLIMEVIEQRSSLKITSRVLMELNAAGNFAYFYDPEAIDQALAETKVGKSRTLVVAWIQAAVLRYGEVKGKNVDAFWSKNILSIGHPWSCLPLRRFPTEESFLPYFIAYNPELPWVIGRPQPPPPATYASKDVFAVPFPFVIVGELPTDNRTVECVKYWASDFHGGKIQAFRYALDNAVAGDKKQIYFDGRYS